MATEREVKVPDLGEFHDVAIIEIAVKPGDTVKAEDPLMSLERRLTEALHRVDAYQPSVDLYARLNRSIEEDKAHRHRIRSGSAAVVLGLGILGAFLVALAERDPDGVLVWPKWSIQVMVFGLLTSCLVVFGPAIRRLGQPYLVDVFHMSPATGDRFSRLLDIA